MVKPSVGSAANDLVQVTGGFVAGGFLGRYSEDRFVTPVTPTSPTTDKILAGAANNVPKVALWYLLETVGLTKVASAVIGQAAYDVIIRLTNQGVNSYQINLNVGTNRYRILNPAYQR